MLLIREGWDNMRVATPQQHLHSASSRLLLQKMFFKTGKLVSVATSIFTSRRLDLVSKAIAGFSEKHLSSLVQPSRLHSACQALVRDLILLTTSTASKQIKQAWIHMDSVQDNIHFCEC